MKYTMIHASWTATFVLVCLSSAWAKHTHTSESLLYPLLWVLWVPPLFPQRPFRFEAITVNIVVVVLCPLMAWGTWSFAVVPFMVLAASTAARTAKFDKHALAFTVISLYTWISAYGMTGLNGGGLLVWQWIDHALLSKQREAWIPYEGRDYLITLWNVWSAYPFYLLAYAQPEMWQTCMAVLLSPYLWEGDPRRNRLESFVWMQLIACVCGSVLLGSGDAFLLRVFLCAFVVFAHYEIRVDPDAESEPNTKPWTGKGSIPVLLHLLALTVGVMRHAT